MTCADWETTCYEGNALCGVSPASSQRPHYGGFLRFIKARPYAKVAQREETRIVDNGVRG